MNIDVNDLRIVVDRAVACCCSSASWSGPGRAATATRFDEAAQLPFDGDAARPTSERAMSDFFNAGWSIYIAVATRGSAWWPAWLLLVVAQRAAR